MIIVLLANGFEEIEALTPVDMLRRAGFDVKTVGVDGRVPTGSHNIPVLCDAVPSDIDLSEVTMAVFPGGMPGSLNLDASQFTNEVVKAALANKAHLAAICAAPLILGRRGLLVGKKATCFPGFEGELLGAEIIDAEVVTDGFITTGKGMEYSLPFAKELVKIATLMEKASSLDEDKDEDDESFEEVECEQEYELEECEFPTCVYPEYELPSPELLTRGESIDADASLEIQERADALIDILSSFNVTASIKSVDRGPRVTRFEIVPIKGTRISSITNLADDIALNLAAGAIRMEAPIPGKSSVGIEIPNKTPSVVRLRELIETEEFKGAKSKTAVCIGRDVAGEPVFGDIAKMPHLIIAGCTGMGKSVCINSLMISMLSKATPDELRLIMIDPKQVEFTAYDGIPHLLAPIITDAPRAVGALTYAEAETERRYALLSELGVRNVDAYNDRIEADPSLGKALPKIVIVIDELADLMLAAKAQIEPLIMRIAQKSRAAGIYLIIGTQRPSVNVITGVIRANVPSRIAFKVASIVDSRTVLDSTGAERLLDRGDMLYEPAGAIKPMRVQSAYVSDSELEAVTEHIKKFGAPSYDPRAIEEIEKAERTCSVLSVFDFDDEDEDPEESGVEDYLYDGQFLDAVEVAVNARKISTSLIQRKLSIGYGKAAKFIDIMEELDFVSPPNGQSPRQVFITPEEFASIKEKYKK